MSEHRIVVLGVPKAQKRHRTGKFCRYDPSKEDKKCFAACVQQDAPSLPLDCPLLVKIEFYFAYKKIHYRTGCYSNQLREDIPIWYTNKPDIDNLVKFVMDALNTIYWKDDKQIVHVVASKQYSEKPRTEILIKTSENG